MAQGVLNTESKERLNVGLTYDLRADYLARGLSMEETAEFDSIETIDAIEGALLSLGHATTRIGNIVDLNARLAAGERWDLVFNIAEGLHGLAREAQVPALLDAFEIPYTFSDALVLAVCLHKGLTKHVVRDLGIPTPDFAVAHDRGELEQVNLGWPVFVKPVAGGSSTGISYRSKVGDMEQLLSTGRDLWGRFQQPVLIERFLPGREFTVGIVGTGKKAFAIGAMEVLLQEGAEPCAYSYQNKAEWQGRVDYELARGAMAEEVVRPALRAWNGLGCRDAGRVDLRCDDQGEVHFLEVNPLAGLNPHYSDLVILSRMAGVGYGQLIGMIMESARERTVGMRPSRSCRASTLTGEQR